MICLTPKSNQSFFVYLMHRKEFFFFLQWKSFLRERRSGRLNKRRKEGFFWTVLAKTIKKDSTTSIRKNANESKIHEKTVRTAIKQNLISDRNPLDYAIWSVLENLINTTSHPDIGSLKTAIVKEWNKMSEEFLLKACKSFRRRANIIIKKKAVAILSKFTLLCLPSYFFVYFSKLKLILFYYRVVYY